MLYLAGLKPTVHSYANLIKAYNKRNRIDDAFNVYLDMRSNGLMPTQVSNYYQNNTLPFGIFIKLFSSLIT
jgi:pentatricopeptide repeat protein